jgi:catechol 2,3-dioxygenase-like lactoylglutathione lyase family enzyme
MLGDSPVVANVAVSDMDAAKQFYQNKLGLNQTDESPAGVMYGQGEGRLFVYQSQTAGSGQATCASWKVDDVRAAVDELTSKGINFEHYDMPGGTYQDGIHTMGDMQAAWFKDPDGNVLCVSNG